MADYLFCPICGSKVYAEYVDVGVGMVQVEPHHCPKCHWVEGGCAQEECIGGKCTAWDYCQGESLNNNSYPIRDPNKAARLRSL